MNKISINFFNESIEFGIDKYKLFAGNNYLKKFQIIQAILQFFNKRKATEYEEFLNYKNQVFFNNNIINASDWLFFEVSNDYSILDDLKMGVKTTLYKYLMSMLIDIEYDDLLHTINMLFLDLNENIIEKINFDTGDINIKTNFQPINFKTTIKLLEIGFYKNDLQINEYNLDYNELILLQLNMIEKITNEINDKNSLVLLDLPILTKEIFDKIKTLNSFTFCFCSNVDEWCKLDSNNICHVNNKFYDLYYDDLLYDQIIMELPFVLTLEDLKSEIINLIYNRFNDKNCIINKFL